MWGAFHNVVVNLQGLKEEARKEELLAEMKEAVRVAQDGLQMVLSAAASRGGK